jgi:hypothetical protein
MPRPYKTAILYHGRNYSDRTSTLSMDGVQYEYWFHSNAYPDIVEHLAKNISLGRALAFAKAHASKCTRVNHVPS